VSVYNADHSFTFNTRPVLISHVIITILANSDISN